MAEAATPSAMAMSVTPDANASLPEPSGPATSSKPEKPDEAAFQAAQTKTRNELNEAQAKTKDLEAKFTAAKPNNKDSPNGQRQTQLKQDLSAIRAKQQTHKASRTGVQERISALDAQLKNKIQDQKTDRSRNPFKNVEEIDHQIAALTKDVDSGKMKIVDEKKSLNQISALNKQKKDFAGYDNKQKEIDAIKAKISETKKEFENSESKALSAEYDTKQAELDGLKKEQDGAFKSRDAHKDAFFTAKNKQSEIYQALKKLQDEYYSAKRAFDSHEREAKRQHYARKKAENEARDLERKKRAMEEELEAAKAPAYLDEIAACNSLIRILDPSSTLAGKAAVAISQFAATAQRMVDGSGLTGTKLSSKKTDEEQDYFVGTGGKKGKKGRKTKTAGSDEASTPTTKAVDVGLFYTPGVSEHFEKIGVKAPSSAEDQTRVLEEVKEKKKVYEETQDKKTEENIAEVQKRFERLETSANGSAEANGAAATPKTNGHVAAKPAATTNGDAESQQQAELGAVAATGLPEATTGDVASDVASEAA